MQYAYLLLEIKKPIDIYVSLLNTTYFDKEGNKAYKKKRLAIVVVDNQ